MVDQRCRVTFLETMHTPDQNLVIATGIDVLGPALETRREVRQYGHAVNSFAAVEADKLVVATLCKAIAEILLVCSQDMHGESVGDRKNIVTERIFANAP